jgi:hypothetical protein
LDVSEISDYDVFLSKKPTTPNERRTADATVAASPAQGLQPFVAR